MFNKKLNILVLVFILIGSLQVLLAQNAAKLRKLAIGEWQLQQIESKEADPEMIGTFFIIGEDGSLKLQARNREKEGTWHITDDGERFQIIEDERVVEDMKIETLTKQDFIISQGSGGERVIFKRFDAKKAEALQKEYSAKIIGKWDMVSSEDLEEETRATEAPVESEEVMTPEEKAEKEALREEFSEITGETPEKEQEDIQLLFEKDGKLTIWENGKQSSEVNTWKIDKRSGLLVVGSGEDDIETAFIEKLDTKEMIILADGERITLKKM